MSRWTHAICGPCFQRIVGRSSETATRLVEQYRVEEACCFCAQRTSDGIYIRKNPHNTPCQGNHAEGD
jgi:hypothetical protein